MKQKTTFGNFAQPTPKWARLDVSTLQAELFDDFEYPLVKKAALRESLYETNDLSTVEAAINAANGVVKIW